MTKENKRRIIKTKIADIIRRNLHSPFFFKKKDFHNRLKSEPIMIKINKNPTILNHMSSSES
jgi:hypothetical protein